MLKKISVFCDKRNLSVCMCIFYIVVILIMVTFGFDFVKQWFVYPEENYQTLENEARRIIEEKTLSTEFNHSVNCVEYILHGEKPTKVTITVNNYGESNQVISIKRNMDNAITYCFCVICAFAILAFCVSFVSGTILYLLLAVTGFVCKKLDWELYIKKRISNKN